MWVAWLFLSECNLIEAMEVPAASSRATFFYGSNYAKTSCKKLVMANQERLAASAL